MVDDPGVGPLNKLPDVGSTAEDIVSGGLEDMLYYLGSEVVRIRLTY